MYLFVKCLVRLGLLIFFRKIIFNNKKLLQQKGPLLLACNHPNSFLDALLLGANFNRPVHFLARGDAFKNPLLQKVLTALKAIPIYRLKEGKEYLALNDNTFERCLNILKEDGIVLIFSEGLCLNQWQLRPLKKGTARIAISAWKNADVQAGFNVLPVSLNYSSFTSFRKNVLINFGEPIHQHQLNASKSEAEQIIEFNRILYKRLELEMLVEKNKIITAFLLNLKAINQAAPTIQYLKGIRDALYLKRLSTFVEKLNGTKRIILSGSEVFVHVLMILFLCIPFLASSIVNYPLYLPLKRFIKNKTKGTVFYHSALFGVLIITYPLYVLIITVVAIMITKQVLWLALIFLMPFSAFLHIRWRDSFESVYNYLSLTDDERRHLKKILKTSSLDLIQRQHSNHPIW